MLEEKTIETIRMLAAHLSPDERLTLIRIITETGPTTELPPDDDDLAERAWRDQLSREATYWYARTAEERRPYLGHYVAVHHQTVIDHDDDRRALYLRVRAQLPDKPVLLVEAEATAPHEYMILSPRLERTTS